MRRANCDQDPNVEQDDDDDDEISIVSQGLGMVLGRAVAEGEQKRRRWEGGRGRAGWRDENRDTDNINDRRTHLGIEGGPSGVTNTPRIMAVQWFARSLPPTAPKSNVVLEIALIF